MSSDNGGAGAWMSALAGTWEVAPLRRFLRGIDQGWSPTAEDRTTDPNEWAVLKLSAVSRGTFRPEEHKALPPELEPIRRLEVRQGDLLLTRANTPELVGDACVVPEARPHLMMSDLIYRLRLDTDRLDPRFTQYWLLSLPGRDQIVRDARGSSQSMVKISQQTIRSWLVPVPPLEEQRAIADYLDEKTSAIDVLIAKRERHIELLEEKRWRVISAAVHQGLGSATSPPLMDSGVPWIGAVPQHWRIIPLKYLVQCLDGRRIPLNATERAEIQGEIPYWGANGVVDHVDKWLFDEPLVLLGEDGAPFFDALKPVSFFVDEKVWINNHIHVLRTNTLIRPQFLVHALNCTTYAAFIDGTTRDKLTQGKMKEIPIAVPPVLEQEQIEAMLDNVARRIDRLQMRLQQQIEKLCEYRQTLISAAVTGQIPVRAEVHA